MRLGRLVHQALTIEAFDLVASDASASDIIARLG